MESLISFMLCCIFLSFFYEISIAIDTIAPNQSIADGQSLVSKGESFELGFFKRGNSKNRYLGIWYNNITPQTVVWIANRNNPLTDSSGVLTISSNGNIVLLNGMKKVIWSSNSSRTTKNPVVQLIDSGNLVLRDDESNSESFIWQSFDYPADTLLPGMKLGENLKTGMDWYLTSWKNADDPSPGDFSYSIEFHGQPQLVLLKGSKKLYRSGIWTGQGFSAYTFGPNSVFIPSLISNKDELYYMYRRNDNAVISKFTLNPYGFLERTIWNNQSREWTVMYEVQKDRCDSYGLCGGNGICRINESPIFCECLTGFTPKSQQEWDLFNWSSGCTRRTQLDCRKGDGFVKFTRVKLPDLLQFWTNKNMSLKECEVECLKNCSCTAYASSGIGGGSHGCLLWFGNLIDVRRLIEVDDDDQDLYIRLAASELESISNSIKKENRATVMVIVSVVSGMLLLGSIIWCFIWKKKTPKAADTLAPSQFLTDGQTLVSSGQIFELGFFRPGNSMNRYLGIWYKNIPLTVVWIANRENPITDSFGVLTIIGENGNLVLLNRTERAIWSSNLSTPAKSPVAQILDSGNLVLRDGSNGNSESYLWQSFDYPTDTLLPGMKLGWNLKTGLNRNLTSWKSWDDPSPGLYSYSVDPHGLPQLVLRMGSTEQFRSGLWYGDQFSGGPVLTANSIFKPIFISNQEEVYYTYKIEDKSIVTRLVLSESGLVQHLTWNNRQKQWVVLFTVQKDHCDTYGLCGPYGICNINKAPNCECLKGFTPKSLQDWDVFDTFGGCVRTSSLDCRKGEGFVRLTGVKLPDTSDISVNMSMSNKECEVECLKNCSCVAYSIMDINGSGNGCVAWFRNLIDIRQSTGYGQDLYVRLSASELDSIAESQKKKKRLKVIWLIKAQLLHMKVVKKI
ncbi:hypothetical protein HHK36_003810 [Tetracentron sinense]|uniref:non-specific serine/threonine protein kinase n=1 Tax=Tetracentron sinense TaxID=13715 RepID=A0A834ZU28_TETSI|nr:hypothetical protein HHK36_003810 [Tetracentron sinense]